MLVCIPPWRQNYKEMILNAGPLGYWRLGEASGIVAVDEVAARNGTYTPNASNAWTGGTLAQPGAIVGSSNTAPTFTTGYITVPNNAAFQLVSDLTIEFWCKPTDNANYCAFVSKGASNEFEVGVDFRSGAAKNSLTWRSTSAATAANDSSGFFTGYLGAWVHVAVTVSANTLTKYRNGVQVGATATIPARTATTNALAIATRSGSTNSTPGMLDEVAIYNRALSAPEILSHYNKGMNL